MSAYHFKNGWILAYEDGQFTARKADVFTDGSRIAGTGQPPEETIQYQEVDARGKLIMPGLINLHTHAYMSFMRNYADDLDFGEWLFQRVMPVEDSLPPECAYWSSLLGFMEMIRTGTTCFMDMHMYAGQPPRAALESGIRAYFGRGLVGEELDVLTDRRFLEAMGEMEQYASERIRFTIAPHAVYSCTPQFYAKAAGEGRKRGLLLQTHLSESDTEVKNCLEKYGRTPVQVLKDSGFLGPDVIAAHCVKLKEEDFEILSSSGTNVVSNPASNAKLGNGFAPALRMKEEGINLCLGTDGAASNNTQNLIREMNLFALIHKGVGRSSVCAPAQEVLSMVTVNPAKALGREGELGVIRKGAKADLVMMDLDELSLFPDNNMISSLCYSADGSEVQSVMIDGEFVMKDHQFLTIDKERVYYEVRKIVRKYLKGGSDEPYQ